VLPALDPGPRVRDITALLIAHDCMSFQTGVASGRYNTLLGIKKPVIKKPRSAGVWPDTPTPLEYNSSLCNGASKPPCTARNTHTNRGALTLRPAAGSRVQGYKLPFRQLGIFISLNCVSGLVVLIHVHLLARVHFSGVRCVFFGRSPLKPRFFFPAAGGKKVPSPGIQHPLPTPQ
jgi:hypothetical protein